jgi:hypothetical protein
LNPQPFPPGPQTDAKKKKTDMNTARKKITSQTTPGNAKQ